jgi:hypothetical protein
MAVTSGGLKENIIDLFKMMIKSVIYVLKQHGKHTDRA